MKAPKAPRTPRDATAVTVSLSFDLPLLARVDALAMARGVTRSQVVRELLQTALVLENPAPAPVPVPPAAQPSGSGVRIVAVGHEPVAADRPPDGLPVRNLRDE